MSRLFRLSATIGSALAALLAAATGVFFIGWGFVVLSKLSADYQDGATATYVIIGVALLGFALASLVAAALFVAMAVRFGAGGRRLR